MASTVELMHLCRLCLVKEQVNVPIFEDQDEDSQIFMKIVTCLPVKINKDDKLPKKICGGCSYKLDLFYQFCNSTTNAEKQLLQWFNKVGFDDADNVDSQPEASKDIVDEAQADSISTETQSYILQQQQLPYGPVEFFQDDFDDSQPASGASESELVEESAVKKRKRATKNVSNKKSKTVVTTKTDASDDDDDEDDDDVNDPNVMTFEDSKFSISCDRDVEEAGPSGIGKPDAPDVEDFLIPIVSIKEDRLVDGGGRPTCDICNKGCKNQRTLREHMKIHNNTYNCEQCDRMFKKVLDYILHMTSHSADGKFQCVNCDYATGEMMDITKHLLARHEKTWKYTCGICKKGFNIFSWFKEHQNFHTGQKPFACSYCEKTFMYSRHLAAHKHIVHKDRTDGDVHECLLCKKQYQHRNSLKLHMNNTHAGNVSVCEVCGKQLSSKEKLKFHMRIHTGYKPFKCSYCEKAFVKKPLLIEHERIHTGVKPYRCTYCEKCFSQRTSLVIHMRNHTGEKPYKCLICAKGFVSRAIMNLHLKSCKDCSEYVCRNAIDKEEQIIIVSNAELRYACSDCDQNFEGIVDFSLHVQNHLADSSKSFACPFCEFTTIFKRSFRNHVRLHAEEEFRYECEICSKKFINKLPYEEHMILHQGLDIYQCDCCPKRFVLERYLAIHKKLNHEQEKDAECEMCGRAFKFSNSLVRHMRSIHKIGTDTTKECPVCYKILSNPYNLKMHMRVHTGETPFICDVCGKGFTKNYKLKQHLNVHQK